MVTGKCPECSEAKEITQQGAIRGMCNDCYTKKYTCVVCNEMITDAWHLYTAIGKGNGHRQCLEPITESQAYGNDCPSGKCEV